MNSPKILGSSLLVFFFFFPSFFFCPVFWGDLIARKAAMCGCDTLASRKEAVGECWSDVSLWSLFNLKNFLECVQDISVSLHTTVMDIVIWF